MRFRKTNNINGVISYKGGDSRLPLILTSTKLKSVKIVDFDNKRDSALIKKEAKITKDIKPPRPQTAKQLYELKIKSNSVLKERLRHLKPAKIKEKVVNHLNNRSLSETKCNLLSKLL